MGLRVECYGLCLDVSQKPHTVIGGHFSKVAGPRVCNAEIKLCECHPTPPITYAVVSMYDSGRGCTEASLVGICFLCCSLCTLA